MSTRISDSFPSSPPSPKHWTVKGSDLEKVFRNLEAHGWWGRYRARAKCVPKPKDGKIAEVAITGAPVITMPKWASYGKASKAEKKSWDDMYKALLKHENTHHTKTREAIKEFKKKVADMGEIEAKKKKALTDRFAADLQKANDDYDTKSKHGKNEGVVLVLPPS